MDTGCKNKKINFAPFSALLMTSFLYGQAIYAAEQVAIVIAAEGKVTANARDLARRSAIFQGETINTAAGGKVAFKFTDGSVVTLKENSSYVIKNYSFNKSQKADAFDAQLLTGGLKTVTGKIGKEAQHTQDAIEAGIPANQQVKVSNYKVKAAIATIGVRGTSYKCVIKKAKKERNPIDNDKLLLSVTSGGITAEYGEDEDMELGVGAVAAYAEIDADGSSMYLSSDPIPDADFDIASGDDEGDDEGDASDDEEGDEGDDEGGDDEEGSDDSSDDAAGDDSGSDSE
ncbi:FecR domain-containing protein [Legionella sp. km772]|uniref:FecR family protein n=1 Tax=Legionella sp. km772 TaxID=2498111 RepID=UPI000F8E6B99|nr:FecR domain-containing protein [Legionella sp. km772]RUR05554.1 hypothetical protein ELY15_14165 [Legionella sp. km772]